MAVRIDGKVYVTANEAHKIMGSHKSLVSYWIYHGVFRGVIDMYDTELLESHENITAEVVSSLKEKRSKAVRNFFLIPLDQVIEKTEDLKRKRLCIKSGKCSTEVENPLELK